MKIIKIIKFHERITKNHENNKNPFENHEKHENPRIPCENNESH